MYKGKLRNSYLYNRDAKTLTTMCSFRKIFILYVQGKVFIVHPKHGSIPWHVQRLEKKLRDGQCHQV